MYDHFSFFLKLVIKKKDYRTMESSDVSGCLLILTNFPADAHEMRKHKMLEPFVNCGGEVSWLGPTEALLVFRCTDKVAEAASIPTPLRIFSLVDYPGDAAGILEGKTIHIACVKYCLSFMLQREG